VITTLVTERAALGRRTSAYGPKCAHPQVAPAPVAAVGPTGLPRFAQGTGMPIATWLTSTTNARVPQTVQTTDQTLAAAPNGGTPGLHTRSRPPV
jgi:hypothetical protein